MKRVRLGLVGLLAVAAATLCCGFNSVYLWSGSYELAVTVSSPEESPLRVYCHAYIRRGEAERLLDLALSEVMVPVPTRDGHLGAVADPFDAQPLKIVIPLDGKHSPLFGELTEAHYHRYLMVLAEYPGGRLVGKVVEIPHYKTSREMTVTLP